MEKLQNVLKEYRNKNGYNQDEIAKKLNVTQQCYANYENGSRLPDIEKLIKLADIYNTSLDLLVGRYKKTEEN